MILRVVFALVLSGLPLLAQDSDQVRSTRALAISAEEAPELDGHLSERVWERAPFISDFRQREPSEGTPASEPTEVRVLYSDEAIYFGVLCYDSEPKKILARELGRDNELQNDDIFSILLDTFHDHRNAFVFRINPRGTKFDAQITDEQRELNVEWDEKWRAAAQMGQEGWSAEIEIPWKTLRSQPGRLQTWGVDFERVIRRKAEETYWANYDQDYEYYTVSQYGHLLDLEEVRGGLKLRIKPYAAAGFNQSRKAEGFATDGEFDGGLETVKASLTPSITADFTINPDFAQAEVDESVFNLTRFSLFFPERREFFLEQAGTFSFGPTGQDLFDPPDMLVFFSRRIGLSQEGEPIPILSGARLTGNSHGFEFGGLNVQTRSHGEEAASNFGVFRLKRKLLGRSYVGGIFTNKSASEGLANRVGGLDANFVFFDNLRFFGMLAKSQTAGGLDPETGVGDHLAYQAAVEWITDEITAEVNRTRIDDNFDPQIGFVRRQGVIRHRGEFRWRPRPANSRILRQYWFSTEHEWFTRQEGFLESRSNSLFLGAVLEPVGDFVGVSIDRRYEFLNEPFAITPQITIPRGGYPFQQFRLLWRSHTGRRISGVFRASLGDFFDGQIKGLNLRPAVKINHHLSLDLGYSINEITLPRGAFTSQVINTGINLNLSTKLLTSATIQHNNINGGFLFNWRLNYIYRPGDDLFIVYRESRDFDDPNQALLGRSLLVKFTHSFDF